ncbi:MAG TPA: Ig-like domain-containing protein [Anaerolineae bacterium]|nr:Ig-like domain-containing protein [Anaerolineae bacterium]HQH37046.1 Ig-like domain-containing protein [Anaerolineae bacterium]
MSKHGRWWLILTVIVVTVLSGATAVLAAWLHLPARLSAATDVCDIEPRTVMSADGEWLASVWIKGRQVNDGCVSRGAAVLRWAGQNGWSDPVRLTLPAGYGNGCFVHADVALNGPIAHLVTTLWAPCDDVQANSLIAYYTCNLQTGVCSAGTGVTSQAGAENLRFSDARIVLDSQNLPHIVYGRGDHSLAQGKLFYTRNLGSGWETPLRISSDTEMSYRPSLAASNGRIHIVWENHRDYTDGLGRPRQRGDVRYRYCAEAGSCGSIIGYPSPTTLDETTYPVPGIAAHGDRVILTWNVCADIDRNPPCEKFYLMYARSNANGTGFLSQPREVGTETEMQYINMSTRFYAGTDDTNNEAGEYATHLNARVELDAGEMPHLVWQMREGAGYVLTTTHAISATEESFTWAQGESPQSGTGSDNRVYPSLGLTAVDETWAHHFVYMQTWREGEWNRSQIFYDVAGPARLLLRLSYTERTSGLPQGRAQVITAHVQAEDGTGANGVPVIFTTTLGSFAPDGYGTAQVQTTTDAQGMVTLTLYSNQVGTAHVSAWADAVDNLQWDDGEPGAVLTQTWVFTGTPFLTVLPGPVRARDWITAVVVDHPYADLNHPEGGGQPLPYYLWWCQVDAPDDPPAQQIGEEFYVNIDTWDHAATFQVPDDVTGTYRLETHTSSGGNPCDTPDTQVAASDVLTATSGPPSTPLITVDKARPFPGGTIIATLWNHGNGVYDVWWCTESGQNIAQNVADNVAVTTPDEELKMPVPLQVPLEATAGLYRLESHSDSPEARCGNMTTYVASSALIWPYARVYLPLIMRKK